MNGRGKLAVLGLAVLVIYLLAANLAEAEKRRVAEERRDRALAELGSTQDQVVEKLSLALERAIRAEEAAREAGEVVVPRVDRILTLVEGLDPELIERALDEAQRAVRERPGPPGPPGAPGERGPPGPGGPAGAAPPATTSSTTTTVPPTTTTTTTSTTTTTTGRCLVELGLVRLGC